MECDSQNRKKRVPPKPRPEVVCPGQGWGEFSFAGNAGAGDHACYCEGCNNAPCICPPVRGISQRAYAC